MTAVQAHERFITVNGLRLRYLDWGTAGKPPMVCLHGHTGYLGIWDEFAESMAPYYHVFTLDQRGHGGSQWATDGYERDRYVEDLATFVDGLGLSRFTLVGLSMGGWNALLYTPQHPERVERVILVDIAPEPSEASRQQRGTRPPTPLEFDSLEDAVARDRDANPGATEARHRKNLTDKVRQREDGKWVWRADPTLFITPLRDGRDRGLMDRYWSSLGSISCPILEVRGALSILVSDEILERMRRANSRFSWVDVAGAGHEVPVDKPQEFISATRAFLGLPA